MGAWFEANILKVARGSKVTAEAEKNKDHCKQVLSESTLTTKAFNSDNIDKKDENENDKMESDDLNSQSSSSISPELPPYDKLFDIVKDDGFLYHVVYEG